jgi:hypothetical protein
MARPRKLQALTKNLSGRIRNDQDIWLRVVADQRFDGEISRTLRWALDQAQVFDQILGDSDPLYSLDRMLNPEKYELPHPEEEVVDAEREFEVWKNEQAIKRARRKAASK